MDMIYEELLGIKKKKQNKEDKIDGGQKWTVTPFAQVYDPSIHGFWHGMNLKMQLMAISIILSFYFLFVKVPKNKVKKKKEWNLAESC